MRKKLYKAGKNWVVASVAIATVGVIGVQQKASADDTAPASDQSSIVTTTNNGQNNSNQQVLRPSTTTMATAAATNQNTGADDAQALQDSINNNTIKLPSGYVNTFNQYTKVTSDEGKSASADDFAKNENQEQQLASQMSGIEQVNHYHHSAADQKVAISDVHNLDYGTAKNVDVWFDGVMNNLVQNNDLKDGNGVLLRKANTYQTNNYTINATNAVNNFFNKYASNDEFIASKGGASDGEQYIFANSGYDLNNPEELAAIYANIHSGGYDNMPTSFKADLLNIRNNPVIKAIEDSLIITNGGAKSFLNEKIANLDQLKEKIYNNFILYNLAGHRQTAPVNDDDSLQSVVANEQSSLSSLFPTLYSMQTVNGNTGSISEYAVGLAVDRAGQVAPHWYLVQQANWGDKDAQPITLAAFTKHQTNNQTNNSKTPASQLAGKKAQQVQAENQLAAQNKTAMDKAKADAQSKINKLNNEIHAEQTRQEKQFESEKAQIEQQTQKAIDEENASYAKAVKDQKAKNDHELQEAEKKVVTPEQKTQQKEQAAKNYEQAQKKLEAEHQSNLTKIKEQYTNDTNKIDAQIAQAQETLDNAKKQLAKDKEALKNYNAANFFKSIADNPTTSPAERVDAQNAYNIVTGTGTFTDGSGKAKPAPEWYAKAVHLGQENDATSLDNLKAALELYDQFVKMRQDRHLSVPKVSLVNVAIAMLDADYQTTISGLEHPGYYGVGENLAKSSLDGAMGAWMAEESTWNEAVKQHPDLAGNLGKYYVFQYHPDVYSRTGHFSNLMAPDTTSYGFAFTGAPASGATAYDFGGSKDGVYSADQYKQLVNKYATSAQSTIDAVKNDQQQMDQYNNELDKLQNNRQNAINQCESKYKQAVQQENKSYNDKLTSLKTAYDQKVKDIDAQPSDVNQLKTQLEAKLADLKAQHEAKLQDIQNAAAKESAAAKAKLNNDPKIKELRTQIAAIQAGLAKKQQELDNQLASLKAKDAADYQALANKLSQSADNGTNNVTDEVATATKDATSQATTGESSVADHQVAGSQATVSAANEESANHEQLPQTGNKNSVIALALGAFAAMLGFGAVTKKRY